MTPWQRRIRLAIGLALVAFIALIATQFRPRNTSTQAVPVPRVDPKSRVESRNGEFSRINQEQEQVRYKYEQLIGYEDGTSKLINVTVITERDRGRTFTITAKEGKVGKSQLDFEMSGDVRLSADDGLVVKTEHATYTDVDGMVRAPGPLTFARGRTTGSGVGMTYAKNTDVLTIFDKATMRMQPDEARQNFMDLSAGAATFTRPMHTVLLERGLRITRELEITESDAATARLTEDEQQITALELRGRSRITGSKGGAGSFKSLSGQDIDVSYRPTDQTIERTHVAGGAAIEVAGDRGQANRKIEASVIDIGLGRDGVTPTSLAGRERVVLTIPAEKTEPARIINADAIDGAGSEPQGLTSARFSGNVEFNERGAKATRTAKAPSLDVDMKRGLGAIDEARFSRGVRFTEGELSATAAAARYVLANGSLELTGSEPGFQAPHVQNDRIDVGAARIELAFEGPVVKARGNVGSSLRPTRKGGAPAGKQEAKTPSMLKSDQEVQVTARDLTYDGTASRATYEGTASLWQGETKIKGDTIVIDDKTGDLTVRGNASTVTQVLQEGKDKKQERVQSRGAGREFRYVEATRKGTYAGEASLVDAKGDLRAATIEVFLKPSGDEVEKVEAHGQVKVTELERRRTATGDDLTFFSADERYVLTGKPVTIVEECARKNEGQTLTFFRGTDRIILNGTPQSPTQTRSDGTSCP